MSNQKIRDLLTQLHDEISQTDLDADTRSLAKTLDAEIQQMLSDAEPSPTDTPTPTPESILERARLLESQFANKHPVAGQAMREVIEILNRIGI